MFTKVITDKNMTLQQFEQDVAARKNPAAPDVIRLLDRSALQGPIDRRVLDAAWHLADRLEAEAALHPSELAAVYELKAVIIAHRGSRDEAVGYLLRAKNSQLANQAFVSPYAKVFLRRYKAERAKKSIRVAALAAAVVLFVFVPLGVFAAWLNSDAAVIAAADPAMAALAERSGMTTKGKVVFLRADPRLLPAAELAAACRGTNVANDAVDGCFDPVTGQIFIRDMPEQFDAYETVTAAHEMLHAAFTTADTAWLTPRLQAAAANAPADMVKELQSYSFLDKKSRANELHSYLATQTPALPPELEGYFRQYFTARPVLVKTYANTVAVFGAKEGDLTAQAVSITAAEAEAKRTYLSYVAAARRGDSASSSYYYDLYSRQYARIDSLTADYNKAVDDYNSMVSLFNGEPLQSLAPTRLN